MPDPISQHPDLKYGAAALKTCRQCLLEKPVEEFYRETRAQGTKTICASCYAQLPRPTREQWLADNRERLKEYAKFNTKRWRERRKAEDPLGFLLYQKLATSKNSARRLNHAACTATVEELRTTYTDTCNCCGRKDCRIVLDHCHLTGKFRGWLCNWCNSLLGHAQDDKDVLAAAIEYLTRVEADLVAAEKEVGDA